MAGHSFLPRGDWDPCSSSRKMRESRNYPDDRLVCSSSQAAAPSSSLLPASSSSPPRPLSVPSSVPASSSSAFSSSLAARQAQAMLLRELVEPAWKLLPESPYLNPSSKVHPSTPPPNPKESSQNPSCTVLHPSIPPPLPPLQESRHLRATIIQAVSRFVISSSRVKPSQLPLLVAAFFISPTPAVPNPCHAQSSLSSPSVPATASSPAASPAVAVASATVAAPPSLSSAPCPTPADALIALLLAEQATSSRSGGGCTEVECSAAGCAADAECGLQHCLVPLLLHIASRLVTATASPPHPHSPTPPNTNAHAHRYQPTTLQPQHLSSTRSTTQVHPLFATQTHLGCAFDTCRHALARLAAELGPLQCCQQLLLHAGIVDAQAHADSRVIGAAAAAAAPPPASCFSAVCTPASDFAATDATAAAAPGTRDTAPSSAQSGAAAASAVTSSNNSAVSSLCLLLLQCLQRTAAAIQASPPSQSEKAAAAAAAAEAGELAAAREGTAAVGGEGGAAEAEGMAAETEEGRATTTEGKVAGEKGSNKGGAPGYMSTREACALLSSLSSSLPETDVALLSTCLPVLLLLPLHQSIPASLNPNEHSNVPLNERLNAPGFTPQRHRQQKQQQKEQQQRVEQEKQRVQNPAAPSLLRPRAPLLTSPQPTEAVPLTMEAAASLPSQPRLLPAQRSLPPVVPSVRQLERANRSRGKGKVQPGRADWDAFTVPDGVADRLSVPEKGPPSSSARGARKVLEAPQDAFTVPDGVAERISERVPPSSSAHAARKSSEAPQDAFAVPDGVADRVSVSKPEGVPPSSSAGARKSFEPPQGAFTVPDGLPVGISEGVPPPSSALMARKRRKLAADASQVPSVSCAVPSGGFQVPSGGFQVPSGGFQVPSGGFQVPSGALEAHFASSAPQVRSDTSGAFQVPTGGFQVPSGGGRRRMKPDLKQTQVLSVDADVAVLDVSKHENFRTRRLAKRGMEAAAAPPPPPPPTRRAAAASGSVTATTTTATVGMTPKREALRRNTVVSPPSATPQEVLRPAFLHSHSHSLSHSQTISTCFPSQSCHSPSLIHLSPLLSSCSALLSSLHTCVSSLIPLHRIPPHGFPLPWPFEPPLSPESSGKLLRDKSQFDQLVMLLGAIFSAAFAAAACDYNGGGGGCGAAAAAAAATATTSGDAGGDGAADAATADAAAADEFKTSTNACLSSFPHQLLSFTRRYSHALSLLFAASLARCSSSSLHPLPPIHLTAPETNFGAPQNSILAQICAKGKPCMWTRGGGGLQEESFTDGKDLKDGKKGAVPFPAWEEVLMYGNRGMPLSWMLQPLEHMFLLSSSSKMSCGADGEDRGGLDRRRGGGSSSGGGEDGNSNGGSDNSGSELLSQEGKRSWVQWCLPPPRDDYRDKEFIQAFIQILSADPTALRTRDNPSLSLIPFPFPFRFLLTISSPQIERGPLALQQAFIQILSADPTALRTGGLDVRFTGEGGAAGPGVLREFFAFVRAHLFDPNLGLFSPVPHDPSRFSLSLASRANPAEAKEYLRFAGRILALALAHQVPLGVKLSRSLFALLAARTPSLADAADDDPQLVASCRSLLAMAKEEREEAAQGGGREEGGVESLCLTFVASVEDPMGGAPIEAELVPGGSERVVRADDVSEFVQRLVQFRVCGVVEEEGEALRRGMEDILGSGGGRDVVLEEGDVVEGREGTDGKGGMDGSVRGQGGLEGGFGRGDMEGGDGLQTAIQKSDDCCIDSVEGVSLAAMLAPLSCDDLNFLLHGEDRHVAVSDWQAHTVYHGYSPEDPQVLWFWEVVESLSGEQRKSLLFFATAVSNLPVNGFRGLAMGFHLHRAVVDLSRLPTAHTCFHQFLLPPYESIETMRTRLLTLNGILDSSLSPYYGIRPHHTTFAITMAAAAAGSFVFSPALRLAFVLLLVSGALRPAESEWIGESGGPRKSVALTRPAHAQLLLRRQQQQQQRPATTVVRGGPSGDAIVSAVGFPLVRSAASDGFSASDGLSASDGFSASDGAFHGATTTTAATPADNVTINWGVGSGTEILEAFVQALSSDSGSQGGAGDASVKGWWAITAAYYQSGADRKKNISSKVRLAGTVIDNYSRGKNPSDSDVHA
ncbi:unnamed protein product, partial [Closterium sp. NIES-54]